MAKHLTNTQKSVLRIMEARGTSAIYTPHLGWTWMQDVRESHKTALAVSRYIKGRDLCLVVPQPSVEHGHWNHGCGPVPRRADQK